VVCGNYGASNLGDEAILGGLLALINSTWPNNTITVMSALPHQTAEKYQVKSIHFFPAGFHSFFKFWFTGRFPRTFKHLWRADLVLLGGGGLFTDENPRAVLIWFTQFLWFLLLRKKVVAIAQSVGPLNRGWARFLTKMVFKYCRMITVRDLQSQKLLGGMGISKVHFLADPAFGIGYNSENFITRQKQLVLSMRSWPGPDSEKINAEIAKFADYLGNEMGLKTVFIPFQTTQENDITRYHHIAKHMETPGFLELKNVQDYAQAIEVIARSEAVIGMRLHSVIFSVLARTPFLALSYSKKVRAFVETMEMENYCLDYHDISLEKLLEVFRQIQSDKEKIQAHLEKFKLKNTYTFFEHEKLLTELFTAHLI
jgi:polysaccharide pyruvyl transferase CsaB